MPTFTHSGGAVANGGYMPHRGRLGDLVQMSAYVQLYELQVPTDPETRYRFARWPEDIEFGTDSAGEPITYYGYSIGHTESQERMGGELPSTELRISNVKKEIIANMAKYGGLAGQPARYLIVDSANLSTGVPLRQEDYEILESSLSERLAVFKLGNFSLTNVPFPSNRLIDQCRFPYQGSRCAYAGVLTSCDKTLTGANGCDVHANQDRYGGFRSVPRNPLGQ